MKKKTEKQKELKAEMKRTQELLYQDSRII